jgi:hypothetical protein
MRPFVFPILSACAILAGCAGPPSSTRYPDIVSNNLAEVKMPVLRSAYFEKEWGAPAKEVMDDGTYRLRFRQGTSLNYVIIRSLASMKPAPENPPDWEEPYEDTGPAPAPHKQSWKHTTILGAPVKWYQSDGGSGADFPGYRTVDFQLTAPDGRTGFYYIEVCADSPRKAADWIHRVSW